MLHSIIIPHRGRVPLLHACLASIHRAAQASSCALSIEVIVIHLGPPAQILPEDCPPFVRAVSPLLIMSIFNKPKLLNIGMAEARGEVLTFLDCDAIASPFFLEAVNQHLAIDSPAPALTRLCYRVRYLPAGSELFLTQGPAASRFWLDCFDNYASFPRGWEGYIVPTNNAPEGKEPIGQPVFGNSQFSIRRATLEALAAASEDGPTVKGHYGKPLLAWDEAYVGHGMEDLDYIHRIHQAALRTPEGYHAHILTDPDHALFHIRHAYEADWRPRETRNGIIHEPLREANAARFRQHSRR